MSRYRVSISITHYHDNDNPHIKKSFSVINLKIVENQSLEHYYLNHHMQHIRQMFRLSVVGNLITIQIWNGQLWSVTNGLYPSRTVKFSHRILNRLEYLEVARQIDISQERFSFFFQETLFIYGNYKPCLQILFKPRKMLKTTQSCLL